MITRVFVTCQKPEAEEKRETSWRTPGEAWKKENEEEVYQEMIKKNHTQKIERGMMR